MDNFGKKNSDNIDDSKVEESTVEYNTTFNEPQIVTDKEWDEMPDILKKLIKKGIQQADEGKLIPHEEVMKQIREKYPFLNGVI